MSGETAVSVPQNAKLPRFSREEVCAAFDEWKMNCGPGALAAILNIDIPTVRKLMSGFEQKGYTNPTLMYNSLRQAGVRWGLNREKEWPRYGLARIQWHGPWMKDGVPVAARYRKTHWVGVSSCEPRDPLISKQSPVIFDINAVFWGDTGWITFAAWENNLVPWLLEECVPKADGQWSITHSIEVFL